MVKHTFYSIILGTSVLLLSGCSTQFLDESPTSNESVIVTKTYYNEIVEMTKEFLDYSNKMHTGDPSISEIESNSKDFIVFLNGLRTTPTTDVEYELYNFVEDFKFEAKMEAESMLEYVDSRKLSDINSSKKYMNNAIDNYEYVMKVLEKYNLE